MLLLFREQIGFPKFVVYPMALIVAVVTGVRKQNAKSYIMIYCHLKTGVQ